MATYQEVVKHYVEHFENHLVMLEAHPMTKENTQFDQAYLSGMMLLLDAMKFEDKSPDAYNNLRVNVAALRDAIRIIAHGRGLDEISIGELKRTHPGFN